MATTTLVRLTWSEQILEHLRGLPLDGLGPMDAWPYATTQDGIGQSLGIARAHVSLELQKLMARERVEAVHAHVGQLTRKRKCYRPTPEGFVRVTNPDGREYPMVPGEMVRVRVVLMRCHRCGSRNRVALR